MPRFKWSVEFNNVSLASGTTLNGREITIGTSPTNDIVVDREALGSTASRLSMPSALVDKLHEKVRFVAGLHGEVIAEKDFHGYHHLGSKYAIVKGHFITRGKTVQKTKKVYQGDAAPMAVKLFTLIIKNPLRKREAGPHLEIRIAPV